MTPAAFKRSLAQAVPPRALPAALQGLWWAGKGDWDKAHRAVMDEHSPEAALVHAYLHRLEGDHGNAEYWYRRARQKPSTGPVEVEWQAIARALLREPGR
jgi:hypothetical protein